jgi:secondary thiamine-phosphate synthase enzyme
MTDMKSYRKEIWLDVPDRRGFVNITPQVKECLRESGVMEGLALVNSMHVTAAVFVDDDEEGLYRHYKVWLERLAPVLAADQYHEDAIGEDIVDAHMKRHLLGREVVVAVTGGRLDFGQWEHIFYGEFDGGRRKRVLVKIIGE